MKRLFAVLVAAGAVAALGATSVVAAPGGVERYQVTTNTYTLQLGYGHTYHVAISPCDDGSVSATGWQWGSDGNPLTHNPDEDITATLTGGGTTITFNPSVYVGGWGGSPYSWHGTFPVGGGWFAVYDSAGGTYWAQMTLDDSQTSTYKNHGAYVSAMGGGADAAHSCIGMPIVPQE